MPNLDTLRSVPHEIICAIVNAAGVDNIDSISEWKDALSFLWVCREWRLVAEPILFSMLIYGTERGLDTGCLSNQELISEHLYFDCVKQIIVCDNQAENYKCGEDGIPYKNGDYPDNIGMIVHIGRLFDDEAGIKDLDTLDLAGRAHISRADDAFAFEFPCEQDGNRIIYDEPDYYELCSNVTSSIVSNLVALCPNVTQLSLKFSQSSITNEPLADILINSYTEQLVKVECNIYVPYLTLQYGHRIQSLVLGNYDPGCGQSAKLPTNHVKNLGLSFKGAFGWDLFKRDDIFSVSYDNLIRLELVDNVSDIANVMALKSQSAENMLPVEFPRLQTLVIQNKLLSFTSLKHFLQFPVKVICMGGYIQHAYQLYEHNLDNLDRLILKIRCNFFGAEEEEDDDDDGDDNNEAQNEFIRLTNKLFAKVNNIPEVHLELDMSTAFIDWTNISWPHITHLYVKLGIQAAHIFTAISKMPNLVYMNATIEAFHSYTVENIKYIAELKHNCTEPLQSKIKNVAITCRYEEPSTEFISALEFLMWYLPELEKLTVVRG